QRNSIELLTIAAITHLPTAVLFVHDPSEECGVSRLKQYQLYSEIKTRFADRVWIDVISKCDLPAAAPTGEPPGSQSDEADGDGRSAGLADLLAEGANQSGRSEGEEGGASASCGEVDGSSDGQQQSQQAGGAGKEGRQTGGSNSSSLDSRDTGAVLLGGEEVVGRAHGEDGAADTAAGDTAAGVAATGVAAWEEYKAHGGPAGSLRVSTVAGVGVQELVHAIQAMLCAPSLASAHSSPPAPLVTPPTATHSQPLPPTQPARAEGSMNLQEDATGQSATHRLEALEGENATGGGSGKAGKKCKASDFYYPPLPSHMMKGT
ncbi:unnamed protein product, partial [Closterium sp. Yama58-4]